MSAPDTALSGLKLTPRTAAIIEVAARRGRANEVAAFLPGALGLGPGRWLVAAAADPAALFVDLSERLGTGAALIDVSSAHRIVRLEGAVARDLIACGCALDTHPRSFPVGAVARSPLFQVPVILHHAVPDAFDLYLPASFAVSLLHHLDRAAAEFGGLTHLPEGSTP